jgi:putative holliday junction resolvase
MIPNCGTGPHPALGIDPGEARIGVAATDPLGILAHPVETIDVARVDSFERIAVLAEQRGIRTLVVGLPLRMDGSEGTAAAKARKFAVELRRRLPGLPVVMVDESLSTREAADLLRQSGRKARNQKAVIDPAAAVEILKRWMDPYGTAMDEAPDLP